jgi:hypothetical protein
MAAGEMQIPIRRDQVANVVGVSSVSIENAIGRIASA